MIIKQTRNAVIRFFKGYWLCELGVKSNERYAIINENRWGIEMQLV
jgi:hypothetical protein